MLKNQVKLAICLLLGVLFATTGCNKTKDLYQDTLPEESVANVFSSIKIPENFKWETLKNVEISLNVDDKYDGKYYYGLQVFDRDPREENPALLDAGYGKKDHPWVTKTTIHSALKQVYVKETTPTNEINYYIIEIVDNKLLDINRKSIPILNQKSNKRSSLKANVTNSNNPNDVFLGDIELAPVTYAFEDNWPYTGDYDLNDCVLEVKIIKHINRSNSLDRVTLKTKILAAGAKRRLAAAISVYIMPDRLSEVSHSNPKLVVKNFGSNGLEYGRRGPISVIPLVDDLNEAFGLFDGTSLINTISGDESRFPILPPVETTISMKVFDTSDFGYFSISPFLINNFYSQNQTRNEIHLPGEYPTEKADPLYLISKSLKPSSPYLTNSNLPFAIAVPGSFKYSREGTSINRAYGNFLNWARSGGRDYQDWYKNYDESLVYSDRNK